jgi:hypothetical protein
VVSQTSQLIAVNYRLLGTKLDKTIAQFQILLQPYKQLGLLPVLDDTTDAVEVENLKLSMLTFEQPALDGVGLRF